MNDKTRPQTIIGPETTISGKVSANDDVVVFGRVEGELDIQAVLFVEEGGLVKAEAEVRHAVVSGHFDGTLRAAECIEVTPTGMFTRRLISPRLVVADGAKLQAALEMSGEKKAPSRKESGKESAKEAGDPGTRYSYRVPGTKSQTKAAAPREELFVEAETKEDDE
jgi:cytoskeletal protein CcmA (bactofilin family)